MSCQQYPQWTDENGTTYPAGYYESDDGELCNPDGSAVSLSLQHTLQQLDNSSVHTPKKTFDKYFFTNGKLNATGIGVLIAIGAAVVLGSSRR